MATFLNTTGVSFKLEELIKNTKVRLVLISPYLQFSDRIREHIKNLNIQKKDIRIIYRENKLQADENNWLAEQVGIRTSICKNLHAKCYMNESEGIITSMNLYEFSQMNNNEMGIHVSKAEDPELFESINQEADRLLTISDEIRVTVQKVENKKIEVQKEQQKTETKIETNLPFKTNSHDGKYFSVTALSKELGISSKDLSTKLEKLNWIIRDNDTPTLTKLGISKGAQIKKGQYGEYIAWPENIIKEIV